MILEKRKTHLHKSKYLYTYIHLNGYGQKKQFWERPVIQKPLHLKVKKCATAWPNKKIIHLYIELDKVMKFGGKHVLRFFCP